MATLANLRALREARTLSLADLAERAGVAKSSIYRLEHGSPAPHPRTIRKIAEALGVEPSQLVDGG